MTAGLSMGGALWFYGASDIGLDMDIAVSAGARWVRWDGRWRIVEPAKKGAQSWLQMDAIFDAASNRGLDQLIVIDSVPTWANDGVADHPPKNPQDYADICSAMVTRYAARGRGCHAWEVFNEPNGSFSQNGAPADPATYTANLKAAYAAIKTADPAALVVAGALVALNTSGTNHMSPADFLKAMYANGAKGSFDALSIHPYCDPQVDPNDGGVANPANNGFNGINELRAILTANGQPSLPIWITEYGNFTVPSTNPQAVSQASQAAFMLSAFNLARSFPNIAAFFIYSHRNDADASTAAQDNYGITNADRTPKAAMTAFRSNASTTTVPVVSAPPVVSGNHGPGLTVLADPGLWTKIPTAYAYQWQVSPDGSSGWVSIPGATSQAFKIPAGHAGKFLRCNVAAANDAGIAPASASNAMGPLASLSIYPPGVPVP